MKQSLELVAWWCIAAGAVPPAVALSRISPLVVPHFIGGVFVLLPSITLAVLAAILHRAASRPHPIYALLTTTLPLTLWSWLLFLPDIIREPSWPPAKIAGMFYHAGLALTIAALLLFSVASVLIYSVAQIRRTL